MQKPHIQALTGIRGFAALWVFLHHLVGQYPFTGHVPAPILLIAENGWLGVDLFFILSGFVMSYVHQNDFRHGISRQSLKRFFVLRFARIYPVHLTILLALVPIYIGAHFLFGYTSPNEAFSLEKFLFSLTLTNGFGLSNSLGWNIPAWSVSAEAFAYLTFPVATWLVFGRRWSAIQSLVAIVALLISAAAYGLLSSDGQQYMPAWQGTLIRLSVEFSIGCLLFNIFCQTRQEFAALWTAPAVIALVGLTLLELPSLWDGLFVVVFAALIYGLSSSEGAICRLLSSKTFIYLGEISYSIYLCHSVVFMVLGFGFKVVLPEITTTWLLISAAIYTLAVLITAHFLYRWVETPGRHRIKASLLHTQERTVPPKRKEKILIAK